MAEGCELEQRNGIMENQAYGQEGMQWGRRAVKAAPQRHLPRVLLQPHLAAPFCFLLPAALGFYSLDSVVQLDLYCFSVSSLLSPNLRVGSVI